MNPTLQPKTIQRLSVLFWLCKDHKSKKTGAMPLYCRITLNGQRATNGGFSTSIALGEHLVWNSKLQYVENDTEEAQLTNDRLHRIKFDVQGIFAQMQALGEPFSALDIHNTYVGKPTVPPTIEDLCKKWLGNFKKKVEVGENTMRTFETYEKQAQYILEFFRHKKLLCKFKGADFEDFRLHLRSIKIKQGHNTGDCMSINSVGKITGLFKRMFELAYQMEWVHRNPYQHHSSPRTKPQKLYLPLHKLRDMHTLQTQDESINKAIEVFLFCAHTGLSYVDYCALTSANIIKQDKMLFMVIEYRQKSPLLHRYGKSYIPLFEEALTILQKYDMKPEAMPRPDSHVLNRHLKFALGLIGASPKICIKHARHTFINWARNEKSLHEGTIATIVGHASLRTTEQHYLNRGLDTVIKDLQKLNLLSTSNI